MSQPYGDIPLRIPINERTVLPNYVDQRVGHHTSNSGLHFYGNISPRNPEAKLSQGIYGQFGTTDVKQRMHNTYQSSIFTQHNYQKLSPRSGQKIDLQDGERLVGAPIPQYVGVTVKNQTSASKNSGHEAGSNHQNSSHKHQQLSDQKHHDNSDRKQRAQDQPAPQPEKPRTPPRTNDATGTRTPQKSGNQTPRREADQQSQQGTRTPPANKEFDIVNQHHHTNKAVLPKEVAVGHPFHRHAHGQLPEDRPPAGYVGRDQKMHDLFTSNGRADHVEIVIKPNYPEPRVVDENTTYKAKFGKEGFTKHHSPLKLKDPTGKISSPHWNAKKP